jgi:hypothetical protein
LPRLSSTSEIRPHDRDVPSLADKGANLWPHAAETAVDLFDNWFDPIETAVRERVREFIEELIGNELDEMLAGPRYGRRAKGVDGADAAAGIAGHRHGSRTRSLLGPSARPRSRCRGRGWKLARRA